MSPPSIGASLIFFFVVALTLFQRCGAAASNTTYDLQYKFCAASSGSLSGVYQVNLRQFLAELPSNAMNNSGFFNGTLGSRRGTVFGMAMCQADIPWPDQCESCLQAVSAKAPMACPSSSNASVASFGCVLRYSDAQILVVLNDDISNGYAFYTQIHATSVPDTAAFGKARMELFTDLASAAVLSPLMIASGNRTFNGTHNLYGLAQCNRDLPRELCSHLITGIVQNIPDFLTDVQWSEGLSITGFSFYIRYDLTPFRVYVPPTGSGPVEIIQGRLTKKVATIVILIFISIIVLLVVFIIMRDHQKKQEMARVLKVAKIQIFSIGDIRAATENFATPIGKGGFGRVYKGKFKIDRKDWVLAVKCVTNHSAQKHLLDELMTLPKVKHRNVVMLIGFCNNEGWFSFGKHRGLYVCNEYVSEGSLDKHIFARANNQQEPLGWSIRYEIIRGICDGLQYLHEHCKDSIAHLDLKPSNILLDQDMKPKIADFGLSRAFVMTKTHSYTTSMMGTIGYMAPELTEPNQNNKLNVGCKCDIYSLGVLILAIVMGKGPTATRDPNGVSFIGKIQNKFRDRNREQLKQDASLRDDDCLDDVETCIGLAFECVKTDPKERPLATEICRLLPARADGRVFNSGFQIVSDPSENNEISEIS